MTIGLSAEGDARVVAMAGSDSLRRDDFGQLIERLAHPLEAGVIVAGCIGVGRVEADAQSLGMRCQSRQDLSQVLELRSHVSASTRRGLEQAGRRSGGGAEHVVERRHHPVDAAWAAAPIMPPTVGAEDLPPVQLAPDQLAVRGPPRLLRKFWLGPA